jgi:hypothetical protein
MISGAALTELCLRVCAILPPVLPAGVTVGVTSQPEGPVLRTSGPEGAAFDGPLTGLGTLDERVDEIEERRLAVFQIVEIFQSGVSTAIDRYWPRRHYLPRVEMVNNAARLFFERDGRSQVIEIGVLDLST